MSSDELDEKIDILYQESVYTAIENILIEIKKIISKMKEIAANIKKSIIIQARRAELPFKLKKMKKNLELQKGKVVTVDMIDYNKFITYYNKNSTTILKKLNKLSDYRRFKNADAFLDKVHDIDSDIDEFENELSRIEKNLIKVNLSDAIQFIENEITGDGKVMKTYLSVCDQLMEFINKLERYKRDARVMTNFYLEDKHMNAVKRVTDKYSKKMSKHITRFVTLTVFKYS